MGMRSDYLKDNDERKYSNNEQYNPEHEKKSGISNLKIYKTTVRLLAAGAVMTLVVTNPYVQKAANTLFTAYIEHDNKQFEQEGEYIRQGVIDLTGSTPEEITERGMSR